MYPIQNHEIRAIRQAEAIRVAQEAHIGKGFQLRRARALPTLISRFVARQPKEADCSSAQYALSPC